MKPLFSLSKLIAGFLAAGTWMLLTISTSVQAQPSPNAAIESWAPPQFIQSSDVRIRPASAVMTDYFDPSVPQSVSLLKDDNLIYVRFRNSSRDIIADGSIKVNAEYAETDPGISAADLPGKADDVTHWITLGSYVMNLVSHPSDPAGFGLFPGTSFPTNREGPAAYRISCTQACDEPMPTSFFLKVTLEGDSDDSDNVALSYYDQAADVPPVDLVLLHDLSGSMGPHMEQVRQRAEYLLALMNRGDRVGIVGFSSRFAGGSRLVASLGRIETIQSSDSVKMEAVNRMNSDVFTADGGTPMGSGVILAQQALSGASPPYPANRAILMLTDGMENSGVRLLDEPDFPILRGLNTDINGPVALYPIWFGTSSHWGRNLLQTIVNEVDRGKLIDQPLDDLELARAYLVIRGILTHDDIYAVHQGTSGDGFKGAVSVDSVTNELILTVSWENSQQDLDLFVMPPGASDWQRAESLDPVTTRGQIFVVHRFQNPDPGQWRYRLSHGSQEEPYLLAALADKVEIVMQSWVEDGALAAGEPLIVHARLLRGGEPVSGASLRAEIQVPERSLGTLLHQFRDRFQVTARTGPDASRADGILQQLSAFVGDERLFGYQNRTVELSDRDGDGVYSGRLEDTRMAGTYKITILADSAPGSGGQGFRRNHNHAAVVSLGPIDPDRTLVDTVPRGETADGAVLWAVRVVPADIYGNFADPGYASRIDLQTSAGVWQGGLDDLQDGSYQRILRLPPGQSAQISATAFGKALSPQQAGDASSPRGRRAQLSFHAGAVAPLGTFDDSFDPGASFVFDLGYQISPRLSALAFFGVHDFPRQGAGSETVWQISVNLRHRLTGGRFSPYLQGGLGAYRIFSDWRSGLNFGGGVEVNATASIRFEFGADFHNVFRSPEDARFVQMHSGVSFHF